MPISSLHGGDTVFERSVYLALFLTTTLNLENVGMLYYPDTRSAQLVLKQSFDVIASNF